MIRDPRARSSLNLWCGQRHIEPLWLVNKTPVVTTAWRAPMRETPGLTRPLGIHYKADGLPVSLGTSLRVLWILIRSCAVLMVRWVQG